MSPRARGVMDGLKAPGGRWVLFVGGCEPNLSLAVPNGAGAWCHSMVVFLWVGGEGGAGGPELGVGSLGMGGGSLGVGWVPMEVPRDGGGGFLGMGLVSMGVPGDGMGSYGCP